MTKTELNKFKKILEAKQAELEAFVRNREGIAIEKSADALDEVQHAAERELAIRNLDRESNLLRNVRAALRRIDEGMIGLFVLEPLLQSLDLDFRTRGAQCRGRRDAETAQSQRRADEMIGGDGNQRGAG